MKLVLTELSWEDYLFLQKTINKKYDRSWCKQHDDNL